MVHGGSLESEACSVARASLSIDLIGRITKRFGNGFIRVYKCIRYFLSVSECIRLIESCRTFYINRLS